MLLHNIRFKIMFKVTFTTVKDVFAFVDKCGSTAGLWKMGAIDQQSMQVVDSAVALSEEAQGEKVHLRTISDTYSDNNGHRTVTMYIESMDVDFAHETVWVEVSCGYGVHKYTMKEYFTDVKENADHIVEAIDAYYILLRAKDYVGLIK
jgi:hypothetical protein